MKRALVIFGVIVSLFISFNVNAQNVLVRRPVITHISASSNIARPITVKTNLGTFTIYGESIEVKGHVSEIEGFDGNGDKIMYPDHSYKGGKANDYDDPDQSYYHFTTLYPKSNSASSNRSSDYTRKNSKLSAAERAEAREARREKQRERTLSHIVYDENAYIPFYIQAGLQYSTFFGESLTARVGGLDIWNDSVFFFAGLGKDYIKAGTNQPFGWFVGVGGDNGYPNNHVSLLFAYGMRSWDGQGLFYSSLEYTYYFIDFLGVTGGGSIGIGGGFKFEAHAGLVFRLCL